MSKMTKYVINNGYTKSKIEEGTVVKKFVKKQTTCFLLDYNEINLTKLFNSFMPAFNNMVINSDPEKFEETKSQKIEITSIYSNSSVEIENIKPNTVYIKQWKELWELNENGILLLTKKPIIQHNKYHLESLDDELYITGVDAETEHLM